MTREELEASQPKWNFIKKNDDGAYHNFHEVEIEVLATDGKLTWIDTMFQDDDGDFFYWDKGGCDIIAWMPLPPPPKQDELPTSGNHKED